jgi:hypothetical protein
LVAGRANDSFGFSPSYQCPSEREILAIGQHGFQRERIDVFARWQRLARQHRFVDLETSQANEA